jgi:hypothetical protein
MIFDVPRITTSTRDSVSGVNSAVIYNLDYNRFEYHNGSSWLTFLSGQNSNTVWSFNGRTGDIIFQDSDVASLGDFTASGVLTITESILLGNSALKIGTTNISPNISGVVANSGSLLLKNDGTLWTKDGSSNTDWSPVQPREYTNEPTGFSIDTDGEVDRSSSTIAFNNSTREFTISVTSGYSRYYVFIQGKLFTKTISQSVTLPNTTGSYYIYFDETGDLVYSSNFDLEIIYKYAIVSIIYWNSDQNKAIYFGDERHGCTMDGHTHARIHQVDGAVYINGGALTGFTIDGNGSSNTHTQFAISSGQIRDEDILHTLGSKSSTTTIPVLYRVGTEWRSVENANQKFHYNTRAYYNSVSSGNYSLTEVANNKFCLYHIVATNDKDNPYFSVMGLNQYDVKSTAREGALTEISQYAGLPFVEFVFIGTIIFETRDAFSNTGKSIIVSTDTGGNYIDWRFSKTLNPSTASVNIHNNLGGIQGGSAGDYYHSNQPINTTDSVQFVDLTLTGNLTVNGTTTNINTTNLVVEDKNIILGDVSTPSDTTADGGGITLKGLSDKTFNWIDSTDSWTSSENINLTSGKTFKINGADVLTSTQVLGKTVPSGTIVGTSDNQTLTTKTISVDDNTISGIAASSFVLSNASGNIDGSASQKVIPSGIVVGTTDGQTLTNKTLQGVTVTGDINSTGTAIDFDLIDNNASALSFDAIGKTGILEIDTTDSSEKVKMSGGLEVTGTAVLKGLTYPTSDGTNGQAIITNGSGALSFGSVSGGGGSSITFTSSTDFPLGAPIYFSSSGTWQLSQANFDSTPVEYVVSSKTGSGSISYTALASGEITLTTGQWDVITNASGGLVTGSTYFLSSNTAGKISRSVGLIYSPVLRALSSTKAFVSLSINQIESGMGDTFYRETTTTVATTTSITLTHAPAGKAYTWLSIDGVLQSGNDFSLAGNTLTLGESVPSGTLIDILYARAILLADSNAINKMVAFEETITGSPKTTFNLPSAPSGISSCIVFVGGSIQPPNKFNISGNILTFIDPIPLNVQLIVYILNSSGISNSIDSFVTRQTYSLPTDGTINIQTLFGSQVTGLYRFFDSGDARISGTISVKNNGTGIEPDLRVDSNSSIVSIAINTANKLNIYISSNLITFQNKTPSTLSLRIYRET